MRIELIDFIGGGIFLTLLTYNLITETPFVARDIIEWVMA